MKENTSTAIIITAFAGSGDKEMKIHMTKKLCQSVKNSDHLVVCASHSPMPVEVQEACDGFIYDSDNDPFINGVPRQATKPFPGFDPITGAQNAYYGLAELKSMHNAILYLKRFPHITNFVKVCYDSSPSPTTDFDLLIKNCLATGKRAVTARLRTATEWETIRHRDPQGRKPWGSYGTHLFWSYIDFFELTCELHEQARRLQDEVVPWLECTWYHSVMEKGLLDCVQEEFNFWEYVGTLSHQYAGSHMAETSPYPY
jgi:hypothetical protein